MKNNKLLSSAKKSLAKANRFYLKNRPQIFTGIGIAGFWGAGIGAVVETPKFLKERDEKKKELGDSYRVWDTMLIGAKHYTLPAATAGVSTALIIFSDKEQAGRIATLTGALSIAHKDNDDLKAVLDEKLNKKKLEEVKDAYYEKRSKEVPAEDISKLPKSKNGLTRILDDFLGYEFLGSPGDIMDAANKFNADIINDGDTKPMDTKDFYDKYADIPITMKFAQSAKYKKMRAFGFNSKHLLKIEFKADTNDLRPDSMIMIYTPVVDYYQDDSFYAHNM